MTPRICRTTRCIIFLAIALLVFSLGRVKISLAQEGKPKVVEKPKELEGDAKKPGFRPMLKGAAHFALGHSKNMAGTTDGTTLNFGYLVNSAVQYLSPTLAHEWQNALTLQLGYSRTPSIDALVKTSDTIDFKSSYLYHVPNISWFGPFASFALITAMLPGDAVLAKETKILKLRADEVQLFDAAGNLVDKNGDPINLGHERIEYKEAGRRVRLTPPFAPLSLRESVGAFAIPLDKKEVKLDLRLGAGAWQTFVRDGYKVDDNSATANTLELRAMKDSFLLGPEFLAVVSGIVRENVVYQLSTLLMYPLYRSEETDLNKGQLINFELQALVQVKLLEWLSLDYTLKALWLPFIIDKWQIQNSLNITVSATII